MSIISDHCAKPSSYVDTLKEQINNGMYDHLFNEVVGIDHAPKNGLVFLDIGANIGLVSIYAVPFCKRIVAIEPSPDVFPVLQANTKDYGIIECYQYALAPANGKCDFFVNDINSTASSTVNTYGELMQIEGRTLKTLLQQVNLANLYQVDVAKLDIEGAEGESLSLEQLGYAAPIIKQWFIEVHNCPKTSWEHKLGTLVGNLARLGYHKMSIDGMAITATRP